MFIILFIQMMIFLSKNFIFKKKLSRLINNKKKVCFTTEYYLSDLNNQRIKKT